MDHARAPLLIVALLLAGCGGSPEAREEHHGEQHGGGHMRHDFSDAERWAKVFDDPARDEWQKPHEVVTIASVGPGMTVADIGAGTGYFVPALSDAVGPRGRVLAIDIAQELIDHMDRRFEAAGITNAEALLTSTDDPGLAEGSVDRILIVNTWHHIGHREEYARKLARSLRPGGQVLIVDYTLESPHGPPAEHRLPAVVIEDELQEAGFETWVARESLPYQFIVVAQLPAD